MSRGCPTGYAAECECPRCACQRMDPEPTWHTQSPIELNLRQIIYNVREEIGLRGDATAARFESLEKQLAAERITRREADDRVREVIGAVENRVTTLEDELKLRLSIEASIRGDADNLIRKNTDTNHDILEGRIEALENPRFVVFPTASGGFAVKSPSGELRDESRYYPYRRVGAQDRRQAGFRHIGRGRRVGDLSRYLNRIGCDVKQGTRVAFDTRPWTRADGTKGSV